MIQGRIAALAALVTLALVASQVTIERPQTLLSDEQTTIAALEHPPLPAARVKHGTGDARADARRPTPRLHAIAPAHTTLAPIDARIADVSTTFSATSPDARSPHSTRSRAPPLT